MYPPTLKTDRFILKPYDQRDEDRWVAMALDEMSIHFMGDSAGIEAEERKVFNKVFEIYKSNEKRWFWIWGIYKDDLLCGHLEMKETEYTSNSELEIVYMIHPEERRKGIMTEVLSLLKQNQKSWQKRIIATIDPKNTNSLSLLKKWGIDKKETLMDNETGKQFLKITLS